MKKLLVVTFALLLLLSGCKAKTLPLPQTDEGLRGELGIDKNINESTIDQYLNRDDAVYIDVRMLKDTANYEAIGGDSYLSGYIKGFKVVPYPYICNPEGLPEDVGVGYTGNALFTNKDGEYIANYKEAYDIVEEVFPKDKVIFLMCGGGGYAGMMKDLLVTLGYDHTKIYDIGGYWYYEGKNKVEVKKEVNGEITYDFDNVPYYNIDFDSLHVVNGYEPREDGEVIQKEVIKSDKVIDVASLEEFNSLIDEKKTFLLYVYLPGCVSCASFKPVVKEFIDSNNINMYQMNYQIIKDTGNIINKSISYTPSIFIFQEGKLLAYLDPQKEEDKNTYKNVENLSTWINEYIDVEIVKSNINNNESECSDEGCKL